MSALARVENWLTCAPKTGDATDVVLSELMLSDLRAVVALAKQAGELRRMHAGMLVEYADRIFGADSPAAKNAGGEYILSGSAVEKRSAIYGAAIWLRSRKPLPRARATSSRRR